MKDNVMDGACLCGWKFIQAYGILRKPEARKHLGSKLRKSEKNVIFKK